MWKGARDNIVPSRRGAEGVVALGKPLPDLAKNEAASPGSWASFMVHKKDDSPRVGVMLGCTRAYVTLPYAGKELSFTNHYPREIRPAPD